MPRTVAFPLYNYRLYHCRAEVPTPSAGEVGARPFPALFLAVVGLIVFRAARPAVRHTLSNQATVSGLWTEISIVSVAASGEHQKPLLKGRQPDRAKSLS